MSKSLGLTHSTGRAFKWNYAGSVIRIVLGFGINILLTRLLGPKPYGEFIVATILFGFGNLLANVGLTSALVQKQDLTDDDIRFCFTCQMGFGILLTLILLVTAPLWANFFHAPGLVSLLRVFSLLFTLQAFGTTATALLTREQDARSMQGISIVSYLVAYLFIAVPMALTGFGVWSLVAAWLSQAFLNSLLSYLRVRHSLRFLLHRRHVGMLSFGVRILGANICSWGISAVDNTVVGRMYGPYLLGIYSRGFSLSTIGDAVTASLMQVLLPAMSRVQADTAKLRNVYASVLGILLMILLPVFAVVAVAPDVVMLGLYGPKWAPAISILRPLALCIPMNSALSLAGPLLAARGKPQKEFAMQALSVTVAVTTYIVLAHWSLLILAWGVLAVYFFRFLVLTQTVNRELEGQWSSLLATMWPAFALAAVAAVAAKAIRISLPPIFPAAAMIVTLGGSYLAVLLCFLLFSKTLLRPITSRSPQLVTVFPKRLQGLLPINAGV